MDVDRRELERRMQAFKDVARNARLKLTHQRLEIFREVASSIEHPAVDAIFRAVRARLPTVSLDTVYRTLWIFEDLGLITTLGPRRGAVRFDGNLKPHHHFVCMHCGLTRDFEAATFDALPVPDAVRRFGEAVATRVEIKGICRDCSRRASSHRGKTRPREGRGSG